MLRSHVVIFPPRRTVRSELLNCLDIRIFNRSFVGYRRNCTVFLQGAVCGVRVSTRFTRCAIARHFPATGSLLPSSILVIAFGGSRTILASTSRVHRRIVGRSHASRNVARKRSPTPPNRLRSSAHATLARVRSTKVAREFRETEEREKEREKRARVFSFIVSFSSPATANHDCHHELVPYRKEDAPDARYASAVAYGNAVHHLDGSFAFSSASRGTRRPYLYSDVCILCEVFFLFSPSEFLDFAECARGNFKTRSQADATIDDTSSTVTVTTITREAQNDQRWIQRLSIAASIGGRKEMEPNPSRRTRVISRRIAISYFLQRGR